MGFLIKRKLEIFLFLIILAAYLILRIPNLTLQPIFADEAIYIRWAQVMKSEPTLRFLPLSDGKTPLFMWTMMPLFKVFEDPLFAGRFLSVLSGLMTLAGVFALGSRLGGKRTGFWAALLYTVIPYTVFFDRMALVDSMLSAFSVWALFFAVWLAKFPRLDLAFILGFILGGGWLTKTPAVVNLFLIPLSALVYKRDRSDKNNLLKLFLFWGVSIGIALVMYNLLRLGPNFHLLSSRNTDYVFSPMELAGRPLDPFIPHLRDISDWFPRLITWPVIIVGVIGLIKIIREKNRLGWVILLWALVPLLLNMTFLRTFTARYLFPSIPLFLVMAGYGVYKISNKFSMFFLTIILIVPSILFNYQLLTNPPPSSLPSEERKGYFEQWTAGYGLKEIARFLKQEASGKSILVGTEGFFGTLPDGLYIYLDKSHIAITGSHATISAQIRMSTKDQTVYFVGNKNNLEGVAEGVKVIMEFPKAKPLEGKGDATVLYQVLP